MSNRVFESTPRFERAMKRYVGKDSHRQQCVAETLRRMGADLFDPRLKTHALSGILAGFHACSCGHDCRIVFGLRTGAGSAPDRIVLVNVGTHEVVY